MHMAHLDRVSIPAHPPHSYGVGYMEWFVSHSHPYVMNVPWEADQLPVARSHFPTTVGQSLIQRFSQFENVEDPAVTAEFTEFIRNVHPQMRAYTGRPPVVEGSRGRGRRSGGRGRSRGKEERDRQNQEVESGRRRSRGGNDVQRWSRLEPTTSRRTY